MSRSIFVSAGHGGGDPGAQGHGHTEADLALELRDIVVPKLERLGFVVGRDGNEGENLPRSTAIARAAASDVALEIHFNSSQPGATGVECFAQDANRVFASRMAKAVAGVLGLKLRGVAGFKDQFQSQHGAKGLGFCRAGGILLEVCFMNRHDLDIFLPKKIEVAEAIVGVLSARAAGTLENTVAEVTEGAVSRPPRGRKISGAASPIAGRRSRRTPQRRVPR